MKILIAILTILTITSCATLFSPDGFTIRLDSQPSNLEYTIIDRHGITNRKTKTPDIVFVSAKNAPYIIEINYVNISKRVIIKRTIDGWYWGNILSAIGFVVDFATGNMFAIPSSYSNILIDFEVSDNSADEQQNTKVDQSVNPNPKDESLNLAVISVDSLTDEQIKQLILLK